MANDGWRERGDETPVMLAGCGQLNNGEGGEGRRKREQHT